MNAQAYTVGSTYNGPDAMAADEKITGIDDEDIRDLSIDPDHGKSIEEREVIDKALVRRLDWYLIPWLCILYLLAFLDRSNIGNAKIAHMPKELGLTGGQYNAALSVFFVSYALFEPVTNVLLKRLKPSIFIPAIMILFGIIMTAMGFVRGYGSLVTCRFLLGVFEAGLFPGVNYYLSCWYKRNEFGLRAAIFFSAAAVSGSFGGLLAAGITRLENVGHLHGWQWIFIIEGLITVLFGVASYWVVQDFPDDCSFLSDDNKQRVLRRLKFDGQSSSKTEKFDKSYVVQALFDWKMWLGMFIYMGADMPLYAFSLFLPTIVAGLNLSKGTVATNQLLSVPPYAAAAVLTVVVGIMADRQQKRAIFNVVCSTIGIAGFAMLFGSGSDQFRVKYAGTFLAALGIYPCIANTISWVANNVEGVYKRGIVLGFVIGWGNLNGVVSSNIYFATNAPNYRVGHLIVMTYMFFCLFLGSILQWALLSRENRARENGRRDHYIQNLSPKEIELRGDWHPSFRYTT